MFKVGELVNILGGRLIVGNPEARFTTFCIDSRYVEPGSVFVPLMGQSRDGHGYVIDALNKGAVAALVRSGHHQVHEIAAWLRERNLRSRDSDDACLIEVRHTLVALQKLAEWYRTQHNVQVLGITGSVGKTGTKEMLIQLLSSRYNTVGTEKNFNNEIGVPLALAKIRHDTQFAVIEMAMRARSEISLLSKIAHPNMICITNTSGSHVGRLGSFEEVYRAKSEIIDGLVPDGLAILNRRDPNVLGVMEEMKNRLRTLADTQFRYFDPSGVYKDCAISPFRAPGIVDAQEELLPDADLWVEDMQLEGLRGSSFTLCSKDGGKAEVELTLLGRGAVENLLAAALMALESGMKLEEIAEAAENLLYTPQRLNLINLRDDVYLIDDCYNSSPASCIDSLEVLLNIDSSYRKILVLGDMLELGKYETLLHRQLAQVALNLPLDSIYAVGPRMNAVNEVEARDGVNVHYIAGGAERAAGEDGGFGRGFGQPVGGRGRAPQRSAPAAAGGFAAPAVPGGFGSAPGGFGSALAGPGAEMEEEAPEGGFGGGEGAQQIGYGQSQGFGQSAGYGFPRQSFGAGGGGRGPRPGYGQRGGYEERGRGGFGGGGGYEDRGRPYGDRGYGERHYGGAPEHRGGFGDRGHGDDEGGNVILDDRAAQKLSALIVNELQLDDRPTVILVKGSRALHLERVVNEIILGLQS